MGDGPRRSLPHPPNPLRSEADAFIFLVWFVAAVAAVVAIVLVVGALT